MNASNSAAPTPDATPRIPRGLIDLMVADDMRAAIEEQMRNRVPVDPAERAMVEAERARLFSSPTWVARYLSGNPAARSQAALITLILDLPILPDNVTTAPQG
jgi:hypothetical protein